VSSIVEIYDFCITVKLSIEKAHRYQTIIVNDVINVAEIVRKMQEIVAVTTACIVLTNGQKLSWHTWGQIFDLIRPMLPW
jgi:hypothetical protein